MDRRDLPGAAAAAAAVADPMRLLSHEQARPAAEFMRGLILES